MGAPLLLLAVFVGVALGTQGPTPLMTALTVPAGRLPEACALASAPHGMWQGRTRVRLQSASNTAPANPWVGTDRDPLVALHAELGGGRAPRMPDALPMTRADENAMLNQLIAGIAEGYVATYVHAVTQKETTVLALRYRERPDDILPPGTPAIDIGLIRARVLGEPGTCRSAIEGYLEGL